MPQITQSATNSSQPLRDTCPPPAAPAGHSEPTPPARRPVYPRRACPVPAAGMTDKKRNACGVPLVYAGRGGRHDDAGRAEARRGRQGRGVRRGRQRAGRRHGTTADAFIAALVAAGIELRAAVPSSAASAASLRAAGLPVVELPSVPAPSLYVDGADQVDPRLRLIKGRGGAHCREKVVASLARRFLCIVDDSKLVPRLGGVAVPLEVVAPAVALVAARVEALGGVATPARGLPHRQRQPGAGCGRARPVGPGGSGGRAGRPARRRRVRHLRAPPRRRGAVRRPGRRAGHRAGAAEPSGRHVARGVLVRGPGAHLVGRLTRLLVAARVGQRGVGDLLQRLAW